MSMEIIDKFGGYFGDFFYIFNFWVFMGISSSRESEL